MKILVKSNTSIKGLLKRSISISSLIVLSTTLSGCALVGSRSIGGGAFDYSISTAATNTVAGDQDQSMPGTLNSSPNNNILVATSPTKYLPPANIGSIIKSEDNNFATSRVTNSNIISNNLPVLQKNSNLGSTNTMPAQSTSIQANVAPAIVASTPPATPLRVVKTPKANAYYHTIESGESLFSIARKYNVTVASIVSANGLISADRIGVGQKVAIPGRSDLLVVKAPVKVAPVQTAQAAPATKPTSIAVTQQTAPKQQIASVAKPQAVISNDKFLWPTSGKIIVDFAGSKNTGINIAVPEGSSIKAAQSGTVIYTGSAIEGYGNLILIKHENGYVSAYAHLSKITTSKGAKVNRGEAIGLAGQTGSVTSSQLHFELRKGATPVDPVPMLSS